MSKVLSIFSAIRELIKLVKVLMNMIDKKRIADAETRRQNLVKAIDDLKSAKTEREILDAQKRIVDNSN